MPPPIFHLGDNPRKRLVWSGKKGALPTCRTTMGFLWFEPLGRWLLVDEIAKAMGWPQESLDQFDHGTRLMKLLGNSMHLANATAVLALALACTPRECAVPVIRRQNPWQLMKQAFQREATKTKSNVLSSAFVHEQRRSGSSSSLSTSRSKLSAVACPACKSSKRVSCMCRAPSVACHMIE